MAVKEFEIAHMFNYFTLNNVILNPMGYFPIKLKALVSSRGDRCQYNYRSSRTVVAQTTALLKSNLVTKSEGSTTLIIKLATEPYTYRAS
jgi:hypothetical protein